MTEHTRSEWERNLRRTLEDPKFEPAHAVLERVRQGKAAGRGFYDWESPQAKEREEAVLRAYLMRRLAERPANLLFVLPNLTRR